MNKHNSIIKIKGIIAPLLLLLLSNNTYGKGIGKVIKATGKPTILFPTSKNVLPVIKNMYIEDGVTIDCPENCYLTIKFRNKLSYLKVGQKSYIKIQDTPEEYLITQYTGFSKILFKNSDFKKRMIIKTPVAKLAVENNKSLIIHNTLFDKTSVINLKGASQFSKLNSDLSYNLLNKQYVFIESNKSGTTEEVQELSPKLLKSLLKAFEVKTDKLD